MGDYTIEARQIQIGPGGHDFWVLKDDTGKIIAELQGLAYNPSEEKALAVGMSTNDILRVYVVPRTDAYKVTLPTKLVEEWQNHPSLPSSSLVAQWHGKLPLTSI